MRVRLAGHARSTHPPLLNPFESLERPRSSPLQQIRALVMLEMTGPEHLYRV
jgi:hypothetical protein